MLTLRSIEKGMLSKTNVLVFAAQPSLFFGRKITVQFLSTKYIAILKRRPGLIIHLISKITLDSLTRGFYPLFLLKQNILTMILKMKRITSIHPYHLQAPANQISLSL